MHDEETLENLYFEEEMKMINICALGPLRVTSAILNAGLMKEGSTIIVITSQGGSVSWRTTQNPEGHDYGHHVSDTQVTSIFSLFFVVFTDPLFLLFPRRCPRPPKT